MIEYRWQQMFLDYILERGLDYFDKGQVENLSVVDNCVSAVVRGTMDYKVVIEFGRNGPRDLYCSCPYAEERHSCKHMAAVLYAFEKDDEALIKIYEYMKENSSDQLVMRAPEDLVREFLIEVLNNNERLTKRFRVLAEPESARKGIEKIKRKIHDHIHSYVSSNNYIHYDSAEEFLSGLHVFLNDDVSLLMVGRYYRDAVDLVTYLVSSLREVEMDDSDGGLSIFFMYCYSVWIEALKELSTADKKPLFKWLIKELTTSEYDPIEEYLEKLLENEFKEKEFLDEKLRFIEMEILKCESNERAGYHDIHLAYWVLRYLELMMDRNASEEEMMMIMRKYWHEYDVRKYYILKCIEKKNYDEAIIALKESINLERPLSRYKSDLRIMLKDIYLETEDREAYEKELFELVTKDQVGDLDLYRELKNLYDAKEWIEKREEILSVIPRHRPIDLLYKEEELFDRLIAFVMESMGLWAIEKYEAVLSTRYPDEILQKYATEVEKMAELTGGRYYYRKLIDILKSMLQLPGGEKRIRDILESWRLAYSRRSAMMDEVDEFKRNYLNNRYR